MKKISQEKRNGIIQLIDCGVSAKKIAKLHHVSAMTVGRIRNEVCPSLEKPRGGRPGKISESTRQLITRSIRSGATNTAVEVARMLRNREITDVHASTVRRALHKSGMIARKKVKKPRLLGLPHMESPLNIENEYEVEVIDSSDEDYNTESECETSESSEDVPSSKKDHPEFRALIDKLHNQAQSSIEVPQQSFKNDPEWETVESIPQNANSVHHRVGNTDWCSCGNCIPMPTREESKCCKEEEALNCHFDTGITCITLLQSFTEINIKEEIKGRVKGSKLTKYRNRVLRKALYREYSVFIHGRLGPQYKIPIPSCMVKFIRNRFPDPDGSYVGFHWPENYEATEMALDA